MHLLYLILNTRSNQLVEIDLIDPNLIPIFISFYFLIYGINYFYIWLDILQFFIEFDLFYFIQFHHKVTHSTFIQYQCPLVDRATESNFQLL